MDKKSARPVDTLASGRAKTVSRLMTVAAVVWIIAIGASLAWNWFHIHKTLMALAASQAAASFDKDMVYRRWVARHGGVYVPPTDETPPNPHLAHLPDRDVTTTDGRRLTLVNPAYMTRQVHEMGWEQYGLRGHITSLKPLRPENAPDAWEAEALRAFRAGKQEVRAVETMDGQPCLRLMRPFVVEAGCLKCHGHQGYQVGDIRGGISISAPLAPYLSTIGHQRLPLVLVHALLGILGLAGIWAGGRAIRRYDHRIRMSEAQFRSLFQDSPVSIIIHDRKSGEILAANPRAIAAYGSSSLKQMKAGAFRSEPPYSFEEALALIQKTDREGPQRFEWLSRRADGESFWEYVHLSPIVIGGEKRIVSTSIDITGQKQIQAALTEKTDLLERITDNMFDMVSIADAQGNIQFLNAAHRVLGYDLDSLINKNVITLIHPDDQQRVATVMAEGLSYTAERRAVEYRYQCADGDYIWLETVGDILKNPDGSIRELLFSSRDITARKRAEAERERLQSQLMQAQKMESVGRLAGGVAHDFNNMLNVIIGFTELSLEKTGPGESLHEDLKEILDAALRSAEIARQLLAFARKQIIVPRVLDLNQIVEGMLKMLRRLIGENINLTWHPGANVWPVHMDPTQIDQILANLLVNARDAIGETGKITIETANVNFDETYCTDRGGGVVVPGDYVLLTVSDNGQGMDEEALKNLFEPFFTTKSMGEGTGLGLSMVYGIVLQNDGCINVYSEPGHGSTFKIYLPRHMGEAEGTAVPEAGEIPPGNNETVLLVEDEAAVLRLAGKILAGLRYNVLAAATPKAALKQAEEHTGRIDLLMTDVIMPGMNGRDLSEKLKVRYPNLRVLFMSGYTADVIAHHGVLEAGIHFIQKPFNRRDLARKVKETLRMMNDEQEE